MTLPTYLDHAFGTRRDVLRASANGFGAIALQWLLAREARAAAPSNPLAPKPQNFPATAKSVIFLYMIGGPSQIDLFDPKPELKKFDGQPLPASYGTVISQFTKGDTPLMSSPWEFRRRGECRAWVSSLLPNLAEHVDDICFVRSFYTESVVHAPAFNHANFGLPATSLGLQTFGVISSASPPRQVQLALKLIF
jgi:hypothetical protein